jgi:GDSL-like Lipase/Acylhydrolase family
MLRFFAGVLVLLSTLLAGMYIHRSVFAPTGHLHDAVRSAAIKSQINQAPEDVVLVFGDSIVELALVPEICGRPVLNAGVGGFDLQKLINFVRKIEIKRSASVIVAIGINDAQRHKPIDLTDWVNGYTVLLDALAAHNLVVMGIETVEAGKSLGDKYFDPSVIAQQNSRLAALASDRKVKFIPPQPSVNGLTTDGVHLTPQGYAGWKSRLSEALGCSER